MKNLILVFGLSLVAYVGFAQTRLPIKTDGTESIGDSKLYIKIYGSYGLASPGSYRSFDEHNIDNKVGYPVLSGGVSTTQTGTNVRYQHTSGGLGQGFRLGGGIGLVMSDFINLGIDADYYSSGQINALSFAYLEQGNTFITSSNITASMITILPNITFKALSKPSFYIYMRLGIGVGIPTVKQDVVTTYNGAPIISQNFTFKGSLASGYLVSLGVQKRLTPQLRAFAEAQFINFSYSPKERSTTAWLEGATIGNDGGEDKVTIPPKSVLADKSTSEKEIQYYDDYSADINTQQQLDKPTKSVLLTMPIASLGLQIGLAYRF
jgi:hypothetical protein